MKVVRWDQVALATGRTVSVPNAQGLHNPSMPLSFLDKEHPVCPTRTAQAPCRDDQRGKRGDKGEAMKRS